MYLTRGSVSSTFIFFLYIYSRELYLHISFYTSIYGSYFYIYLSIHLSRGDVSKSIISYIYLGELYHLHLSFYKSIQGRYIYICILIHVIRGAVPTWELYLHLSRRSVSTFILLFINLGELYLHS